MEISNANWSQVLIAKNDSEHKNPCSHFQEIFLINFHDAVSTSQSTVSFIFKNENYFSILWTHFGH